MTSGDEQGRGSRRTTHPEKFRMLLDRFPHPERADEQDPARRRWKITEIEAGAKAIGEKVSAAYLSGVLHENIKTIGMDKAHVISQVMNFPFQLWLTEPDTWEQRLWRRSEVELSPDSAQVTARRLQALFDSQQNPDTHEPYTTEEVSLKSGGRVSAQTVEAILSGTLTDPSMQQLGALCDVFGIDFSYFSPHRDDEPVINREVLDALADSKRYQFLQKSDLTEEHSDVVLMMMEYYRGLERNKGKP